MYVFAEPYFTMLDACMYLQDHILLCLIHAFGEPYFTVLDTCMYLQNHILPSLIHVCTCRTMFYHAWCMYVFAGPYFYCAWYMHLENHILLCLIHICIYRTISYHAWYMYVFAGPYFTMLDTCMCLQDNILLCLIHVCVCRTIFYRALCLLKHGIQPVFVMDGRTAPEVKSQTLQERSQKSFTHTKEIANDRTGLQSNNSVVSMTEMEFPWWLVREVGMIRR